MKVMTDQGEGQITYVNNKNHTVRVQFDNEPPKTMLWKEIDACENK